MNEQLKTLLKKLKLSEGTVTEIQTMLEAAMDDAKAEGKKEAEDKADCDKDEKMSTAMAAGKKEADDKADAEKEVMKEAHAAEITFLKEKAEDYGMFLKEKANAYGDYLKEKANSYGDHIKESVSAKMKDYADYAVENFITENKERFVETEEYSRMKSAFGYIREAFEKNAFDVREDVAVSELKESLVESTRQYESLFEDLAMAREALDKANREIILERATADLADTQKERVNELLEAVSFETIDEYKDGVSMIVEQAKTASKAVASSNKDELLTESNNAAATAGKKVDNSVAAYMTRPGLF